MRPSWWRPCAAFVVALPFVAFASSVLERPLAERARMADRVVLAQVLESKTVVTELVPPRVEGGRPTPRMITVTRFAVGQDVKGTGPAVIELVQLGGRHGLWESRVPGDATFEQGEVAVLLLTCKDAKAPARCGLMGLGGGKLRVLGNEVLVTSVPRGAAARRPLPVVLEELRGKGAP